MFEGRFDIKLIDARTGHVKRHLQFKNLITNAGLDYLGGSGNPSSVRAWCGVGTGNTVPAVTDTALVTPLGTRVGISSGPTHTSGGSFLYWSQTVVYTFLEANANGNLTEIGLFSSAAGPTMWTRQLLKDGAGVPTVIVKTAAEQLQVTYEMRLYSPTVDVVGTVAISGNNYDYTVRAAETDDSTAWGSSPLTAWNMGGAASASAYETDVLGTTIGRPAGTPNGVDSSSVAAYGAGTYYRDHTYVYEPANANFPSGIGSHLYGQPGSACAACFQLKWVPKIPKTAIKRFTLTVRLNWGRYP